MATVETKQDVGIASSFERLAVGLISFGTCEASPTFTTVIRDNSGNEVSRGCGGSPDQSLKDALSNQS